GAILFEESIQDPDANFCRFPLLQRLNSKAIIGCEYQLRARRWIVAIDLINVDQILQEECRYGIVGPGDRLHCFLGAGLNECGDPFHEWLAYEDVFAPAVQINE